MSHTDDYLEANRAFSAAIAYSKEYLTRSYVVKRQKGELRSSDISFAFLDGVHYAEAAWAEQRELLIELENVVQAILLRWDSPTWQNVSIDELEGLRRAFLKRMDWLKEKKPLGEPPAARGEEND
jgi:hypothetical protein